MDQLVWNAARRLAWLVAGALTIVGALLLRDALLRRGVLMAGILAGSAAYLTLFALLAMRSARRFFGKRETPQSPRTSPYRDNAEIPPDHPLAFDVARATRGAAGALVALAFAAALIVVAAASR